MQKCTCFPLKTWHLRVITNLHDVIVSLVTDVKGEVQPITDHEDPERSGSIAVLFFNLSGVNTTTRPLYLLDRDTGEWVGPRAEYC